MESLELTPSDHIVFTTFDDAEGLLVDLNTKQYFRLNQTGMFVWGRLEKGRRPADIAGSMRAFVTALSESARLSTCPTCFRASCKTHRMPPACPGEIHARS